MAEPIQPKSVPAVWRIYTLFALAAALYFAPLLRVLSHSGDEGELLNNAVQVVQGQLPFRDFFEGMAPGTYYSLAIFFKLFGSTFLATRLYLLTATVILATVLFYLARRLGCGTGIWPVVFFAAVSYHSWNTVSHHMDSGIAALLSFAILLWWIDSRNRIALFLAGAGAGLTTCFLQPKGLCLFLAFLLIVGIYTRSAARLAELTAGFAAVGFATVAWFTWKGGLADLIYAIIVWPLTVYGPVNSVPYGLGFKELYWKGFTQSFIPAFSRFPGYTISALLSFPLVVAMALPLLVVVLGIRFRGSALDRRTAPYWIAGVALFLSEMQRKDLIHIVYGSPLLILLAYHFSLRLRSQWAKLVRDAAIIGAVLLAVTNSAVALLSNHKVVTRRGVVYDSEVQDPTLAFLLTHTQSADNLFVYPYAPMYYFLTATRNPTRFNFLMYRFHTPEQFREIVDALERSHVQYVVWEKDSERTRLWFPNYSPPSADREIVEPYLRAYYTPVFDSGRGVQVLERRPNLYSETSGILPQMPRLRP